MRYYKWMIIMVLHIVKELMYIQLIDIKEQYNIKIGYGLIFNYATISNVNKIIIIYIQNYLVDKTHKQI